MKKILFFVLACSSLAYAQTPTEVLSTDTLSSVSSVYADGQIIKGVSLVTRLPKSYYMPATGWFTNLKLELDTAAAGMKIELIALKDTSGVSSFFTAADHTVLQLTKELARHIIGAATIDMVTYGTTAGGATASYGDAVWYHQYNVSNYTGAVYWLMVARSASTLKKRGVITLTASVEAN